MLSFRRKSTVPGGGGGKNEAASPQRPPAVIADAKDAPHDDDFEDIFSAVLSSASSRQPQSSAATATAAVDEQRAKDRLRDEEKEGKPSLPPPFEERASLSPSALPSLSKPEITADNLRAISAVPAVSREGAADESKDSIQQQQQQHVRKTSSTALIAEILGTKAAAASTAGSNPTSAVPLSPTVLSPPPLLSVASMSLEAQQRREGLPLSNMRDIHGEAEQSSPAPPPPTPSSAPLAPPRPPPPMHSTPPPVPRPVPPPISVASSGPFTDTAPPATPPPSTPARLPPIAPPAALSRSPPPRPTRLAAVAASIPSPSYHAAADEGTPNTAPRAAAIGGSVSNPFDDDNIGEEVEAKVAEGSLSSSSVRSRVVAVAAYSASASDQLSCVKGEVLEVMDDSHTNWTMVCNVQGQKGLVPASYVRKQRKEEEGSSAVAAVPLPAQRQSSTLSHRRTASQPPLQLLGSQPRSPTLSVPISPVGMRPPLAVSVPPSPSTSPPSSTLRLPSASLPVPSVPLVLRLPQPLPQSPAVPPPLPRPPSAPLSPVMSVPTSPPPSSRLLSHESSSPPVPTAAYARPPPVAVMSASYSSPFAPPAPPAPPATPSVAESITAAPAMEVCAAEHSYSALAPDQLSMTEGEKLLLVDRHHPHWWKVVNSAGETGLVPTSYITLIQASSGSASSYVPVPRPPPTPPAQPSAQTPSSISMPVSVPPPLQQVRSLPPPIVPRPPPAPAMPAGPAPPQPPLPPPLTVPHPARQMQQQFASTPTAASTALPTHVAPAAQHRHSMSLNTISAPIKPAPPAAIVNSASAPATPINARPAAVEPPSFPLPPTAAARNTPLPPTPTRPPPPAATPAAPSATAAATVALPAVSAATLVVERGEAVHSFDATDGVQLSVSRGDALFIMQRLETGWTVCRLLHTGITGLVPTSYIRSTTERPAAGG